MSKTAPNPDVPLSLAERRLLNRALGCAVEEFIARFGAETAVRRVQTELRRARRARSRKLYNLWSAMLVQIEMDPRSQNTRLEEPADQRDTGARTSRSPPRASAQKTPITATAVLSTRNRDHFGT